MSREKAQTAVARGGVAKLKGIREAATELGVESHVLRFWETRFRQLQPIKQESGRRLYRPSDMDLLHRIHALLRADGMTIKGANKILNRRTTGGASAPADRLRGLARELNGLADELETLARR